MEAQEGAMMRGPQPPMTRERGLRARLGEELPTPNFDGQMEYRGQQQQQPQQSPPPQAAQPRPPAGVGDPITRLMLQFYNHIEQKSRTGGPLTPEQRAWDYQMQQYMRPRFPSINGAPIQNPDPAKIYRTPSLGYRG